MFLENFFTRKPIRRFTFTPYYYVKQEVEGETQGPRIKFRRIRHGTAQTKKPILGMAILAVFLIFCLYYLWSRVEKEQHTFRIEDIKVEEVTDSF